MLVAVADVEVHSEALHGEWKVSGHVCAVDESQRPRRLTRRK